MLVDRDDELAEIARFLDRPVPGLLAVVGQAGAGKSTLVSAAASVPRPSRDRVLS